jgi:hypothetical protein
VKTSRFDPEPWALRGFILAVHFGERQKALSAYRVALSLDPGNRDYEAAIERLESEPR